MGVQTVSNIGELFGALMEVKHLQGHVRLAWRGHGDADWNLETTLHRYIRIAQLNERQWELTLSNEFLTEAPGCVDSTPSKNEYAKWLVIMRHHGLPVRMLDWTWNPLVASYFAVCEDQGRDGMVWALNTSKLNAAYGLNCGLGSLYADQEPLKGLAKYPFSGAECPSAIFAVAAPHATRRIAAQQGLFTIHGVATPLNEIDRVLPYLSRFKILASAKESIRKDLEFFGMSRKLLFSDLDSLAKDLREAKRQSSLPASSDGVVAVN